MATVPKPEGWWPRFKRKLLCGWLGQHNGNGPVAHWFDGASWHAACGRCGRNVMLDSQGNWFTFEQEARDADPK